MRRSESKLEHQKKVKKTSFTGSERETITMVTIIKRQKIIVSHKYTHTGYRGSVVCIIIFVIVKWIKFNNNNNNNNNNDKLWRRATRIWKLKKNKQKKNNTILLILLRHILLWKKNMAEYGRERKQVVNN